MVSILLDLLCDPLCGSAPGLSWVKILYVLEQYSAVLACHVMVMHVNLVKLVDTIVQVLSTPADFHAAYLMLLRKE